MSSMMCQVATNIATTTEVEDSSARAHTAHTPERRKKVEGCFEIDSGSLIASVPSLYGISKASMDASYYAFRAR